jgi:hypothetical protein
MPTLCLHAVKATLPRQGGSLRHNMVAVTTTEEHLDFFVTAVPKRWLLIKLGIGLSRTNSRSQCLRQNITVEVEPVPGILPRGAKCSETGSNGESAARTRLGRQHCVVVGRANNCVCLLPRRRTTTAQQQKQLLYINNNNNNDIFHCYWMIPYSRKGEEEEYFFW